MPGKVFPFITVAFSNYLLTNILGKYNTHYTIHILFLHSLSIMNIYPLPTESHFLCFTRMIGLPTGIIGFLLAKRQVDKDRLKQLKIRQRMKNSNEGEFEGSRYRPSAETIKLDQ